MLYNVKEKCNASFKDARFKDLTCKPPIPQDSCNLQSTFGRFIDRSLTGLQSATYNSQLVTCKHLAPFLAILSH